MPRPIVEFFCTFCEKTTFCIECRKGFTDCYGLNTEDTIHQCVECRMEQQPALQITGTLFREINELIHKLDPIFEKEFNDTSPAEAYPRMEQLFYNELSNNEWFSDTVECYIECYKAIRHSGRLRFVRLNPETFLIKWINRNETKMYDSVPFIFSTQKKFETKF
jgi:hypothetical protein